MVGLKKWLRHKDRQSLAKNDEANTPTQASSQHLGENEVVAAYRTLSGDQPNERHEALLVEQSRFYNWTRKELFLNLITLPEVTDTLNLTTIARHSTKDTLRPPQVRISVRRCSGIRATSSCSMKYAGLESGSPMWSSESERTSSLVTVSWTSAHNIGYFSALMSTLVGTDGRVHAFEPMPHLYNCLEKMREANGFTNLELHNEALGDHDADVWLEVCYANAGGNKFSGACKFSESNLWISM